MPKKRLTSDEVRVVLEALAAGAPAVEVARAAGVSRQAIYAIRKGLSHCDIGPRTLPKFGRLSHDQVREIRRRAAEGEATNELAAAFDVGRRAIWLIVSRRSWAEVE